MDQHAAKKFAAPFEIPNVFFAEPSKYHLQRICIDRSKHLFPIRNREHLLNIYWILEYDTQDFAPVRLVQQEK